jgi:hypothetical protein
MTEAERSAVAGLESFKRGQRAEIDRFAGIRNRGQFGRPP